MVSTCPSCFTPIEDSKWVVYSNAKYHNACFTCHSCERQIGSDEVFRHNGGLRTCVDCAKKEDPSIGEEKVCYGCDASIDKVWVIGLDQKWHAECFKCCECSRIIDPTEKFYRVEVEGKKVPKCTDCRVVKGMATLDVKDKTCPGCEEEITSSWVVALDAHWHKSCFKCSHCDRVIDSSEKFMTNLGKPVCMGCNNDHFRKKCGVCAIPIVGTSLIFQENSYHYSCVKCFKCDVAFQEGDHENIRIVNGKDFKHAECPPKPDEAS